MPLINTLGAVPTSAPEVLNAATANTALFLPAAEGIKLCAGDSSGSTVLRVYFWVPLPVSIRAAGGQWVPLGGDAASGVGASPTTVTAGTYGGAANGRYQSDLVSQWWCVVRESGTPDWVTLDAVSRYIR